MNILDYIIIIVLILGALTGYKKGLITSLIGLVGTIVVVILAFYLKNPVSVFLYEHCPFFNFSGIMKGITVYNIIIFEAISFIITLSVMGILASFIGKITGIVGKMAGSLLSVGLIGRIFGLLLGIIEGFLVAFFLCFIVSAFCSTSSLYHKSKYCDVLVSKTPILKEVVNNTYNSIKEVYDITMEYQNIEDKDEANKESLNILLKYEIISYNSAKKLVDSGRVKINNADELLDKYKEA